MHGIGRQTTPKLTLQRGVEHRDRPRDSYSGRKTGELTGMSQAVLLTWGELLLFGAYPSRACMENHGLGNPSYEGGRSDGFVNPSCEEDPTHPAPVREMGKGRFDNNQHLRN